MRGPSLAQWAVATLGLGLLVLASEGRVIENGYALDAVHTIEQNPNVRADADPASIFSSPYWDAEAFPGRGLYRPLTLLGFHLTRRIQADPVALDHATDLGLHLLCGLALLAFLMRMGGSFGVALVLCAIFLVHPVQTEVVASLVGRSDLLATLLALLALDMSLAGSVPAPALGPALFLLSSLSLLAKESTVGLFVILPACWAARAFWQGERSTSEILRRAALLAIPLGLAIVGNLVLREAVLGDLLVTDTAKIDEGASGFFASRWRALAFVSLYFQKLVWPHPLLPDYLTGVVPRQGPGLHLRAVTSLLLLSISLAWPVRTLRRSRRLSRAQLGVLLFWIAMAPVSNLVLPIGTPFGERLLYFPMIFLLLASLDLPLWRPVGRGQWGKVPRFWPAWLLLIAALGLASARRIPEWRDNRRLFRAAVRDCPGNYYSQVTWGSLLLHEGRPEDRERARRAFLAATRASPDESAAWTALGRMAIAEGDLEAAREFLEKAHERAEEDELEIATLNLARTYRALGAFAQFESLLVPAAQAHPEALLLQRELGGYWLERGRDREALRIFEGALANAPRDKALWRQVIRLLLRTGQEQKARERLEASPPGTLNYPFRLQLEREGFVLPGAPGLSAPDRLDRGSDEVFDSL